MNPETGEIHRNMTLEAIKAAQLVPVSEKVADAVEIGMEALNRAERRLQEKLAKRAAKKRVR